MRILGRALEWVVGDRIPPPLRPVLASILANFAALSVFLLFFGPWLVTVVHATAGQAAVAYVVSGAGGVVGGYAGGHASDRLGRRRVVVAGAGAQLLASGGLLVPGIGVAGGCAVLVTVTFFQPFRGAAQRAALADLAEPGQRERAFAGYRLVTNVGGLLGPLLGAGLVGAGWRWLHGGIVALFAVSLALGLAVPARATRSPRLPRPRFGMVRDARLWLLLLASTAAWTVVSGYETVVPISLTQSHGVSPTVWGLVYSLGPALVIVLQLRLTRWLRAVPATGRLAAGTVLMGAAFLPLLATAAVPVLPLVVVVFVLGDLLWGPASEDAVNVLAPPGRRGAYVGVLTASIWIGNALAPGVGLPVRQRFGEPVVWLGLCALGVASAVLYRANGRTGRRAYADTSS